MTAVADRTVRSPFGHDPLPLKAAQTLAAHLRVLASPPRLQMLGHLAAAGPDGLTVTQVVELIGYLKQPTVSHHLDLLVRYGLADVEPGTGRGVATTSVHRLKPEALSTLVTLLIPGGTR